MEPPQEEQQSMAEQAKYYATLTLGLTACASSFIFMFLIPWVLDPSISTLVANFDPVPVTCKTIHSDHRIGMKNCTWSSCKIGCTTDMYTCEQIYVSYMNLAYDDYDGQELDDDNETMWMARGVPLLINIKACGYPPGTNCSIFSDNYGVQGAIFGCFYSRVDKNLVMTNYEWITEVQSIILALIVPNVLCGISLGVVSYWWYPGCQNRGCQYQLPPDQEDESLNTGEECDKDSDGDEEEDGEGDGEGKEPDKSDSEISTKKDQSVQEDEKELDTSIIMPDE